MISSLKFTVGLVLLLLFLVGDGARMVCSAYYMYSDFNPFVLVFFCASMSLLLALCWIGILRPRSPCLWGRVRGCKLELLCLYALINIFTFSSWVSGYWAIKYLIPGVFSMIAVTVGPMILIVAQTQRLGAFVVLVIVLMALAAVFLSGLYGVHAAIGEDYIWAACTGMILSVLCGFSVFINTRLAVRIGSFEQNALDINAWRGILVVVGSLVVCIRYNLFVEVSERFSDLLFYSFFFVFLVQLSLQFSIACLGAVKVTLGLTMAPVLTVLVQVVFFDVMTGPIVALIIFFNTILLIILGALQLKNVDSVNN